MKDGVRFTLAELRKLCGVPRAVSMRYGCAHPSKDGQRMRLEEYIVFIIPDDEEPECLSGVSGAHPQVPAGASPADSKGGPGSIPGSGSTGEEETHEPQD